MIKVREFLYQKRTKRSISLGSWLELKKSSSDDFNNSLKDQLVDGNITWKQAQNEVKQIVRRKRKEKVG